MSNNLPYPPEFFEGDLQACANFRDLIDSLNASDFLISASDDSGISLAVQIALFKDAIKHGDSPEWRDIKHIVPAIGSRFRELCQRICTVHGASVPPKILRAIVETVKGDNLSAVHAIRASRGGSYPQKIIRGSDNAKAWRRDIDREFHLHYWECANGKVELASVAYHDDFSIPE